MVSSGHKCQFPRCIAKYQRKEHLSRHEAQHTRRRVLQCPTCAREFGRSDTLRRHILRVHGVPELTPQIKKACTHCRNQKIRCHGGPPCANCQRREIECSLARREETATDTRPTIRQSIPQQPRQRRTELEDRFIGIYFDVFHSQWPFIHRGTFIEYETPLLVQSMVAIGLWMSGEEKEKSKAIDLHNVLGKAIRQQTEQWDGSESEHATPACKWPIPTYQAMLLHIISAGMMKSSVTSLQQHLKPSLPPVEADLLHRLVASCKRLGMLYYPNILTRFSTKEPEAYVWVSIEEIKRFNLALFKLCSAVSAPSPEPGDGDGIDSLTVGSRDEAGKWGLLARELQFPLPSNTPLWNALTPEEWFAADTPDVYRHSLHDNLEQDWISRSADVLELIRT
ncbi:hypothetical protein BO79DRAFT_279137 [Aspergillus costaricaensis CBS 115574]|uniref:Uncharacterized protein n=1 Tax=Aspergillus costaricaensis CBS 115574 TaxID=1448317 RepID=A0ACD1HY75_9EURO|nr:hypothetical protein BO79DRAFT_279137 [Aspergillus costaricaensis CBS 115574]RAK83103.1 hypothetical protein BO79DRAFT_279137 [Aspergillus costaricaensis CBS 115574]